MLPEGLQNAQSPKPITYKKVLLVEGKDAFQFFKALLRHLNLLSDIEIRNFGGVDDLDYLGTLKITDGFDHVISLAIIRDAESNAVSAFHSVNGILEKEGFDVPPQPMETPTRMDTKTIAIKVTHYNRFKTPTYIFFV